MACDEQTDAIESVEGMMSYLIVKLVFLSKYIITKADVFLCQLWFVIMTFAQIGCYNISDTVPT